MANAEKGTSRVAAKRKVTIGFVWFWIAAFILIVVIDRYIEERDMRRTAATLGVSVEKLKADQAAALERLRTGEIEKRESEKEQQATESQSTLIRQCKALAKSDAAFPSSVSYEGMVGPDFPFSATEVSGTGDSLRVTVPITALNSFGNRVPLAEVCLAVNGQIISHNEEKR